MAIKKYIADSKMFEYDKHYRNCMQNNMPFIKAKTNPLNGHYHVQIDLMPCGRVFTEEGKQNLKKLFESELELLKPKTNSKPLPDYSVEQELSWIDEVLPERLDGFCETLYQFSEKFTVQKSKI
ncbi:hypothetical protein NsoK4_03580 [Nitrosopumilus sp. K4]|uniref:hypothetical protein n=1 Tax=Nitrosopumilus sp. K4 TaxID=2795383 RepID=UPI001BAB6E77|nr:hypothetical protein [Nitrosopumilus sp. K4]QUC65336.1 hypothetical protein NsoK4_03580 [Nitrosopumilus sp. K4]